MKLKEYPISFYNTVKLVSIPLSRLNDKSSSVPVIVTLTTIESRLKKAYINKSAILYPPGIMNSQIANYELTLKLAPKSDDLREYDVAV